MIKQLADWLDDRTGFRELMKEALDEPIPGGARWRYVFGSALTVVFMVQVFTGHPLDDVVQPVVVDGLGERLLYQPRDVVGLVHPRRPPLRRAGDGGLPGAAPAPGALGGGLSPAARVQLVVRDGPLVPHARLQPDRAICCRGTKKATGRPRSRPTSWAGRRSPGLTCKRVWSAAPTTAIRRSPGFTACTSACCRPCSVLCLAAHVALFRRHGITPPPNAERRPTAQFWPEQLFLDTLFCAAVVGVVIYLVLAEGGANLDAPADPSSSDYPRGPSGISCRSSRCSRCFPGDREMIGTIVIPTALVVVMLILPFLDRILPRRLAHFLACGFVFAVVGGAGYPDGRRRCDADAADSSFQESRKKADAARQRAIYLAGLPDVGIPPGRLRLYPATGPAHSGP